ncbi:MAG: hypothetical protein FWC21_03460 [Treponema sp.]|nr:hypothetical protein [Treponema sp.]
MAITPIDLQTLFTQVDKVGRAQAAEREGQALHQSMQGVAIQRKTDEHVRQVNEAQNTGEGPDKINDNSKKQSHDEKNEKRKQADKDYEEDEDNRPVIKDLNLGNKIDISF